MHSVKVWIQKNWRPIILALCGVGVVIAAMGFGSCGARRTADLTNRMELLEESNSPEKLVERVKAVIVDILEAEPDKFKGPEGDPGVDGAPGKDGAPGVAGTNGIHCWDLDGSGAGELSLEDINHDGSVDVTDCRVGCEPVQAVVATPSPVVEPPVVAVPDPAPAATPEPTIKKTPTVKKATIPKKFVTIFPTPATTTTLTTTAKATKTPPVWYVFGTVQVDMEVDLE